MQDFGETVLDVVVALAATSFCFMGVSLKEDAHAQAQKPQQVVVRRVPAPQPPRRVIATATKRDCPKIQRV